jgi:hypothetical protein
VGVRVYTAHYRPTVPPPDREVVLVKEGFCWPALFVSPLWALWHRLWIEAVVLIAAPLALEFAFELVGLAPLGVSAAGLGLSAIIACVANDLRRASLERRGYRMAGVVAGSDYDTALARLIDARPEITRQPTPFAAFP